MMFEQAGKIGLNPEGREIYFRDGALMNPGQRLVQKRLAETLRKLSDGGGDYFYRSEFTQRVVDTVKAAGGSVTMEDFDRFEVRWQEPAGAATRDTVSLARRRRTMVAPMSSRSSTCSSSCPWANGDRRAKVLKRCIGSRAAAPRSSTTVDGSATRTVSRCRSR